MTHGGFDQFLEPLQPLSDAEKRELLLRYFNVVLESMSSEDIRLMRHHYEQTFPPSAEQTMFFEVIEGHLALRALNLLEDSPK